MFDKISKEDYYGLTLDDGLWLTQVFPVYFERSNTIAFNEINDEEICGSMMEYISNNKETNDEYNEFLKTMFEECGKGYLKNKGDKFPGVSIRLVLGDGVPGNEMNKLSGCRKEIDRVIYTIHGKMDTVVVSDGKEDESYNITFNVNNDNGNCFSFDLIVGKNELKNFYEYFNAKTNDINNAWIEIGTLKSPFCEA